MVSITRRKAVATVGGLVLIGACVGAGSDDDTGEADDDEQDVDGGGDRDDDADTEDEQNGASDDESGEELTPEETADMFNDHYDGYVAHYERFDNEDYDQGPHGELDVSRLDGDLDRDVVGQLLDAYTEYHETHADPVGEVLIDVYDEPVFDQDDADEAMPRWWFDIREDDLERDRDEAIDAIMERVSEDGF